MIAIETKRIYVWNIKIQTIRWTTFKSGSMIRKNCKISILYRMLLSRKGCLEGWQGCSKGFHEDRRPKWHSEENPVHPCSFLPDDPMWEVVFLHYQKGIYNKFWYITHNRGPFPLYWRFHLIHPESGWIGTGANEGGYDKKKKYLEYFFVKLFWVLFALVHHILNTFSNFISLE